MVEIHVSCCRRPSLSSFVTAFTNLPLLSLLSHDCYPTMLPLFGFVVVIVGVVLFWRHLPCRVLILVSNSDFGILHVDLL